MDSVPSKVGQGEVVFPQHFLRNTLLADNRSFGQVRSELAAPQNVTVIRRFADRELSVDQLTAVIRKFLEVSPTWT
jgi:hypothetical protein